MVTTSTRRDADVLDAVITEVVRRPRATLAELAQAAGVGRTTLFHSYATRSALLQACGVHALTVVVERLEAVDTGANDGGLTALLDALIPVGPHLDFIWRTPTLEPTAVMEDLKSRYGHAVTAVVSAASAAGVLRADVPDWWAQQMLESVVYVAWERVDDGHLAPREAPALARRTLLKGLGDE